MSIDWNSTQRAVATLAQRQHDLALLDARLKQEHADKAGQHDARLSALQRDYRARRDQTVRFRDAVRGLAATYDVTPAPWTSSDAPAWQPLQAEYERLSAERAHIDALNGAASAVDAAKQAALPNKIVTAVWLGLAVLGTAAIVGMPLLLSLN